MGWDVQLFDLSIICSVGDGMGCYVPLSFVPRDSELSHHQIGGSVAQFKLTIPKNPSDPSQKFVGLMVAKSYPHNRIIG